MFTYGPLEVDIDLSENELTSLDNMQFHLETGPPYFNIHINLNLSHNNFRSISLFSQFQVSTYFKPIDKTPPVQVLDLSHNQLQAIDSDFLSFTDLRELYLSHNNYRELPVDNLFKNYIYFRMTAMMNLKQLTILDLSYNQFQLHQYTKYSYLPFNFNKSTPIRKVYLFHNHIHLIPRFVYISKSLTYVDLSHNEIPRWPLEYTEEIEDIPDHSSHTAMNLSYNHISDIWFNFSLDKPSNVFII